MSETDLKPLVYEIGLIGLRNGSRVPRAGRWLKSPDVRYTQPLEASTKDDECPQLEDVAKLRAQVAELQRKLRSLELLGDSDVLLDKPS